MSNVSIKNVYEIHKLDEAVRARFYQDNGQIVWSESCKKWICTNKDIAEQKQKELHNLKYKNRPQSYKFNWLNSMNENKYKNKLW